MSIRDKILAGFDSLPPQQQLVAEYVLDHPREVAFVSVPELARRSGASEATVVRFAQRLGYEGFVDLKAAVIEALRTRVVSPTVEIPPALSRTPDGDTPSAVARQEMDNIRRTVEDLDAGSFRAAAEALFAADQVYTVGLGISAHMAELFAYLLTQIGLRATSIPRVFSSPLEALVALRSTDMLVAISFPPYSRHTIDMLREAKARGVPSLAICDRRSAPAARLAQFSLDVRSDNMMFTNSFAAISFLLNALTTEIALQHREDAAEAVARISRILDDDEGLIR